MRTAWAIATLLTVLLCLAAVGARADTYDTHTLALINTSGPEDVRLLYDCHIDITGRKDDVYRVLLTEEQLRDLTAKGLSIQILYDEMAEDRRLWREADEASRTEAATAYYTASKFTLTSPPSGSLMEHLLSLYNAHPDICRLYNLGATQDGAYDIIAMKVTRNPDAVEPEPKIRIYGNIHGDEKIGCMVACDVLDTILAGYTAAPPDATAQKLVDESEMWFIPMGNPYGNAHSTRYNSRSVDLNRNFWGPAGSGDGYPSAAPWTEKETQAIRDLTEAATADHSKKRFTLSISFHSGAECFNSVWNYTTAAPSDEPAFWASRTPGTGCSDLNGCLTLAPHGLAQAYKDGCTQPGFWFTEGGDWYVTNGDTNDWSYGEWTGLDTTIELDLTKTPATTQIATDCGYHRQAVLNYMMKAFQGLHGVMTDASTGAPLDGTVTATCTASSTIPVPHVYSAIYTDPVAGDFHRVLQPGTYTVTCKAAGYVDTVVPGAVVTADTSTVVNCSMSGPCANNPSTVDVTPNGPIAKCPGASQVLSAAVTGGTGTTYQWTMDGSPIGGATSSTYTATASGTHSYNCKVTGSGCTSGVSDPTPTQITWQTAPVFGGITSVANPMNATCTLSLGWSAASSACPGTITYKVYRSTATPVSTVPGNLAASGLTGTTYSDAAGLAYGTTYYYVVHAVDGAAQEDANALEMSGVPTGSTSTSTLFSESFDGAAFPPLGWSQADTSGTSGNWARATATVHPSGTAPHSGGGLAYFNSYTATSGNSTRLKRNASSALPGTATAAALTLWVYHDTGDASNDRLQVQVSTNGSTWTDVGTAIARYDGSTGWKQHTVSLNAFIGQSVYVGLNGVSAYGNDVHVDDVSLNTTTAVSCSTGSSAPGEVAPGDSRASAQTWSDKQTTVWPAAMGAQSYNVYYGLQADLPGLTSSAVDSCLHSLVNPANTSDASFTEDPTAKLGGFYWYLITAVNLAGEGSAGNATAGARVVNLKAAASCPP